MSEETKVKKYKCCSCRRSITHEKATIQLVRGEVHVFCKDHSEKKFCVCLGKCQEEFDIPK